jgi:hypothetical protein
MGLELVVALAVLARQFMSPHAASWSIVGVADTSGVILKGVR